jgi:hypothetical protein
MGKQLPVVRPRESNPALLQRIDLANRPRLFDDRQPVVDQTLRLSRDASARLDFVRNTAAFMRTTGLPHTGTRFGDWKPEARLETSEICTTYAYCALNYGFVVTAYSYINVAQVLDVFQAINVVQAVYISGVDNFGVAGAEARPTTLPGAFTSPVL